VKNRLGKERHRERKNLGPTSGNLGRGIPGWARGRKRAERPNPDRKVELRLTRPQREKKNPQIRERAGEGVSEKREGWRPA